MVGELSLTIWIALFDHDSIDEATYVYFCFFKPQNGWQHYAWVGENGLPSLGTNECGHEKAKILSDYFHDLTITIGLGGLIIWVPLENLFD